MDNTSKILSFMNKHTVWAMTLAVPLLTLTGYLIAFAKEYGYFSAIGIPVQLIEINTTELISSTISLIAILSITAMLWYLLFDKIQKSGKGQEESKSYLLQFLGGSICIAVLLVLLYYRNWSWSLVITILLSVVLVNIINSLIFYMPNISAGLKTGFKWVWNKTRQFLCSRIKKTEGKVVSTPTSVGAPSKQIETKLIPEDTIAKQVSWGLKRWVVLSVFVLIFVYFVSYAIGQAEATTQKTFLTVSQPQYSAVLRVYPGKLICVPVIKVTGKSGIEFNVAGNPFVILINENNEYQLTVENVHIINGFSPTVLNGLGIP